MYERRNNVIFALYPLVIFGAFLSLLVRNFPEIVIIGLVPKMLERSPVNFNSRRILIGVIQSAERYLIATQKWPECTMAYYFLI